MGWLVVAVVVVAALLCGGEGAPRSTQAGLVSPDSSSPELSCTLCKFAVAVLRDLLEKEKSEDEIVKIAIDVCIDVVAPSHPGYLDSNVCRQIVPEFKDEVLSVADDIALSPEEVCGEVVGPDCAPSYDPWRQHWNVSLPNTTKPPVLPVQQPLSGDPVNRILHLSDLHYDRSYTAGLSNDCGEPLCCRPPNAKGSGSTAAGPWGDYNCDVPYQTLENLMQHLASKQDQFDWIYLTGDLPAHNVWNQSREDQLNILKEMMDLFKKYLPSKTVFPAVGNHESAPVNSYPPPYITGQASNQWLLDALAEQWSAWLPPDALDTVKKGGYYNVKIRHNLRVISLQTNYGNPENYWLLINSTDPAGQLAWLVQQLQAAEDNKEKVHIIGHIPNHSLMQSWSWNYYKIVNRYESTIVGQFFGHAHTDSLSVFFDEANTSRPVSVQFIGPAVTTYTGLNLGYRIYHIDGDYAGTTNTLVDFVCYYLNVSEANLSNSPKWVLEYQAKADYGMKALQPSDWLDLINRFYKDDKLFMKFFQYNTKMHSPPTCDNTCKSSKLCGLIDSRSNDPKHCPYLFPGVTMEEVWSSWNKDQSC